MYSIKQITPPSVEPVTLDELRLISGANTTVEDDYLNVCGITARMIFERLTGRVVMNSKFRQRVSTWNGGPAYLMVGPVTSVTEVGYYDADNETATMDLANISCDIDSIPSPIYVQTGSYPSYNTIREYPVWFDFFAGAADRGEVDSAIKSAILNYADHLFKVRGVVVVGTIVSEIPLGFKTICDLYQTGVSGTWGN